MYIIEVNKKENYAGLRERHIDVLFCFVFLLDTNPILLICSSTPGCHFSNICPRNISMFFVTALVSSLFLMCITMTAQIPYHHFCILHKAVK